MHVSRMSGGQHGTSVSGNWSVSILMGEGLEVHGLGGIHFLAETEQMESSIGADFVFHALWENTSISIISTLCYRCAVS